MFAKFDDISSLPVQDIEKKCCRQINRRTDNMKTEYRVCGVYKYVMRTFRQCVLSIY